LTVNARESEISRVFALAGFVVWPLFDLGVAVDKLGL
jgi:hypothetical protein